jgi:hypothetical protein
VIERTLRIVNVQEADDQDADAWSRVSPSERLAAVEAIRRATFALYGCAVPGLERILTIADAPSSALPPDRRPRHKKRP